MSGALENEGGAAAFFDLDGTLVPEPSLEKRFFRKLREAGAIPAGNYARWMSEAARLMWRGIGAVQNENKAYLHGLRPELVCELMETIMFFEEGLRRVEWHVKQGHAVVLLSGTLQPLAELAATALEYEIEARGVECTARVHATRLRTQNGRWTGRVEGEVLYGEAKRRAMIQIARDAGFDRKRSFAYGDSPQDKAMLGAVGRAHAVNPGRELADAANRNNWDIWHWHVEKNMISRGCSRTEREWKERESHA